MSVTPEVLRAAVYLETMARADAPFKPSGKTRRGVKCDPPNKKCGNRCIPPNWNCRITGGGLDSHSKAVQYDPVSGTNNLVRGVKNVIQGTQKADPELLTRGIKGVERGVVKLTPGQTKDEKERLKQKIQVIGTIAFTGILTGIAVHKTHGFFSNFKWYREGVGKKVEDAARTAVDNVMNTWDASVNRLGLGSMASGRAQITGNAMRTATLLGRQSRFREVTETRLTGSPRDSNFLANRALLRTSGIGGSNFINLQVIDAEARRGNWTRAQWEARKVEALYSQRTKPNSGVGDPGVSVFAAPAAHEYLAAQWGFKMPDKRVNRESTTLAEGEVIKGLLRTSVRDMHSSLVSDMERRGVPRTTDGIRQYTEQLLRENPSLIPRSLSTRDQRRLNTQFRQNISNILELRTYQQQNKYASDLYRNTVTMYDSYFTSMASTLETDRQTRRYLTHPTKLESAAGVAEHGLARYHAAGRGPSIRPRDRTGASFLNGYYFDQVVRKNRGLYEIPDTKKAIQYANSLANRPIRTLAEAEAWYRENNLRVRIPRPRRLFQTDSVSSTVLPIRVQAYLACKFDASSFQTTKGKPCGKSFIPDKHKCLKGATTAPEINDKNKKLKTAAVVGAVVTAAVVLGALGINQKKVNDYRSHVSDSAFKAEAMAKDIMDEMRQGAARRLNKDIKDVTGFEASVYNFKDTGYDRGFGSLDKDPSYFGQTPNSRGAVVMLSYADDNRFTRRGQGSFKMANGGSFQEIWGEHDILPFANNISQPKRRGIDDISSKAQEDLVKKAGPFGSAVRTAAFTKETFSNFEYLQENVNKRGYNPDAIRAAAFVAAQRRLTGKPVHLMAYSNGGNVASETLAILNEMGYRDVKVVNIAGPTFGMFKHAPDNMRTWVSPGDRFWSVSRGAAFQGSNVQLLRNRNIPHGLTEKIDPNNREYGSTWKQNYKQKNSYLLDEQLQQEAYRYLTVDSTRSRELTDEFVWRISEKKNAEGDLDTLMGNNFFKTKYAYLDLRKQNPEKADQWLRNEIEKAMIDKWYGGYNPKSVKNRQKQIKKDLQTQIYGSSSPT